MKKATKIAGVVIASAVCVTSMAAFVACTPAEDEGKQYVVTYMDGTQQLKQEKVKEGEKAVRWEPQKDNYTFVDWFATPNYMHRFDFDAPITENKSAFALFASANQSEDTREYYIVGSGTSPVLLKSNWGKVFDSTTKMTKEDGKNEYKFTLDLQKDDQFQFALNADWHNQRGAGYLKNTKLADGTVAFSGTATIGDNPAYRMNIKCEYAGNYTFTLKTHPDDDAYETNHAEYTEAKKENFNYNPLDSIEWTRNGDVQAVETVTDYYIKGSGITDWKDMYNSATKMTNTDGVYSLEVFLKANEEFMFTSQITVGGEVGTGTEYLRASNLDDASKAFVDQKTNMNMVAKATGTYKFTYNNTTKVLSVAFDADKTPAPADYYIDGTFAEGVENWSYSCNPDFKLTETEEGSGIFEIKNVAMKLDSEFIIQVLKAGATEPGQWGTEGYNRLGSHNYTYVYGAGANFSAVGGNNMNIKVLKAGNYDITFNAYAKMITITEVSNDMYDIYIKGENVNGWAHNFSSDYKFTLSEDELTYEFVFTVEDGKPVNFGVEKFNKGVTEGYGDFLNVTAIGTSGDANDKFVKAADSNNITCSTAGRYKVVYDIGTGKIDFYALPNA